MASTAKINGLIGSFLDEMTFALDQVRSHRAMLGEFQRTGRAGWSGLPRLGSFQPAQMQVQTDIEVQHGVELVDRVAQGAARGYIDEANSERINLLTRNFSEQSGAGGSAGDLPVELRSASDDEVKALFDGADDIATEIDLAVVDREAGTVAVQEPAERDATIATVVAVGTLVLIGWALFNWKPS